jgi:hypothetical protein
MRPYLIRQGAVLAAGLLVLLGWAWLGRRAGDDLRDSGRTALVFADTECDTPPGMSRGEFLTEVQYLGELPDRIPAPDAGLPARLAAAFSLHPWVAHVERIEASPGPLRAKLTFRTPVLAASWQPDEIGQGPTWRVVDGFGVLLPQSASLEGVPRLMNSAFAPTAAGRRWTDVNVQLAARTMAYLAGERAVLPFDKVEVVEGEIILRVGTALVRWGRAPGDEIEGEPRADDKRRRLIDAAAAPGGVAGTLDLRSGSVER